MATKFVPVELGKIPQSFGLRLEVPTIDPDLLSDPARFDELIERKCAAIEQIQKGLTEALGQLVTDAEWLAKNQPQDSDDAASKEKKQLRLKVSKQTIAERTAGILAYINECLNNQEPTFKRAAAVTYLNFQFGRQFKTLDEAAAMLRELQEKNLFVMDTKGSIKIGYQKYSISPDFGLEPDDSKKVETAVAQFAVSYLLFMNEGRKQKSTELAKKVTLSLEQFLQGVNGKFLLKVLPKSLGPDPKRPGQDFWAPNGDLLLEVKTVKVAGKDIQEIIPLEASGSIEKSVAKMKDLDIRLGHYTLVWDTPPGAGKAFQRVKETIMNFKRIPEKDAEECVKKTQALWHFITGTLDALAEEAEMAKLKEEFGKQARFLNDEFEELNPGAKGGIQLFEFEGVFGHKQQDFRHVFFIGQRTIEDGVGYFEVLEAPDHVKELLSMDGTDCFQKLEEEENFFKLPLALGRLLRAIRGRVEMKRAVASNETADEEVPEEAPEAEAVEVVTTV